MAASLLKWVECEGQIETTSVYICFNGSFGASGLPLFAIATAIERLT